MDAKDIKHLNPKVAEESGAPLDTSEDLSPEPGGEPVKLIAEVHTRVLDTIAGFDKMVEKAEPDFQPMAEAFLSMHKAHERVLSDYLRRHGHDISGDGSLFGAVNRGIIEARSWFENVDDAMIDRVVAGEKHVLEAYETARAGGQSIEANAFLTRQMEDINLMLNRHAG